ncbi:MAG: thiamine phosphate synthase [Pyrinomonadaceae bacterium]
MPLQKNRPLAYLITNGTTTRHTTPQSEEFTGLIKLVRAAVEVRVDLIQIREKELTARTLYELARHSADITRDHITQLLINDRADIARAANADGVHLKTRSLSAKIVRQTFGAQFLVGVSCHSIAEAQTAYDAGADFATFSPVFDTPSKQIYGSPVGLENLRAASQQLSTFPLIALGGITRENMRECLHAGAEGVAAIRMFENAEKLRETLSCLRDESY